MYAVYRHLDEDNSILYVGKSINLLSRCMTHKHSSRWLHSCGETIYRDFNASKNIKEEGFRILSQELAC